MDNKTWRMWVYNAMTIFGSFLCFGAMGLQWPIDMLHWATQNRLQALVLVLVCGLIASMPAFSYSRQVEHE